jgi:hypothetical protein
MTQDGNTFGTAMPLAPPVLSVFDPEVSAEGGVDPFSLQATYERLAERIFPFITVRMSRPRFLTAMAVGAVVCQEFADDVAADGKTPAWLVFEWHVVEALIRTSDRSMNSDDGWGIRIPGFRKVRATVDAGHAVRAESYLKTPKIFGFTGVYRRLAYGLDIIDDDLRLSEGADALLRVWESERGLPGFLVGTGPGGEFRRALTNAVRQAMKKGCTCQPRNWHEWQRIANHLNPGGARKREANVIFERLRRTNLRQNVSDPGATQMRREMFDALARNGKFVSAEGEPSWFRSLRRTCSQELAERLEAINAFEKVSALIMDAFDIIRHLSTRKGVAVTAEDFSKYKGRRNALQIVRELPPALERLRECLQSAEVSDQAERLSAHFGDVRDIDQLFAAVIQHHEWAQSEKPPDGKRSWFDRDGASVNVRPFYRTTDDNVPYDFVHPYRCATASSFLRDLKRLS